LNSTIFIKIFLPEEDIKRGKNIVAEKLDGNGIFINVFDNRFALQILFNKALNQYEN
jgi:hypothetical protein